MRIDLPQCGLKTCRNCFDGNCKSKSDYDKCDYTYDKNRLAELEEKLEEGMLIELPCKVEDTVYSINLGTTYQYTVTSFETREEGMCAIADYVVILPLYQFGKTVFLTEAEALERLNP